jgi:hypothetical protein
MRIFTALKISFRKKATIVRFAKSEVADRDANLACVDWPMGVVRRAGIVQSSLVCLERRSGGKTARAKRSGGAQNTEEGDTGET